MLSCNKVGFEFDGREGRLLVVYIDARALERPPTSRNFRFMSPLQNQQSCINGRFRRISADGAGSLSEQEQLTGVFLCPWFCHNSISQMSHPYLFWIRGFRSAIVSSLIPITDRRIKKRIIARLEHCSAQKNDAGTFTAVCINLVTSIFANNPKFHFRRRSDAGLAVRRGIIRGKELR